ncbi:MAG: ABC transporter substrate-binding protein [Defluviitaleaceae bacterium]|nr:ABC transporter substrate-binding protein [Defluviitaleaceae bacterium]
MADALGVALTVTSIEGIRKINDYELEIVTNGFAANAVYSLGNLTLAPLHYYGDKSLWQPENGLYGFPFGDLSIIHSKDTVPLGAGPYKYVSYSDQVLYYEANPYYWEGEPEIKHAQWKGAASATELSGIIAGTHDIAETSYSPTNRDRIKQENSNGELSGDVIYTTTVPNLGYGYIGLNASNINVGGEPASDASKNLRRALATVMAAARETAVNSYYQDTAFVIDYPISYTSWAAPMPTDDGYEIAFSRDVNGDAIYTPGMTPQERYDAAIAASLGFFEAAGYTVDGGTVTAPPAGVRTTLYGDASYMEFEAAVGADGGGDHPNFAIYTDFKEAMATIGITITISDLAWNNFQTGARSGEYDIWTMAWGSTIDPDVFQIYHSTNMLGKTGSTNSNMYMIDDPLLDELLFASRNSDDKAYRKAVFKQIFDIIMDWAVELPSYQRSNFICFSEERVNTSTIAKDSTTYWSYLSEIATMQMRNQ